MRTDGAYYYVWEAYGIPARPWPAQDGLVLVKEQLWAQGVPVAYMQLDDCKDCLPLCFLSWSFISCRVHIVRCALSHLRVLSQMILICFLYVSIMYKHL